MIRLLAVILAVGLAIPLRHLPHPDLAWSLYVADEILQGARLGVDYLDINPPLYFWFPIPAVLAARLTGLTPWVTYLGMCGGLIVASLGLSAAAFRLMAGRPGIPRSGPALALLGFTFALLPLHEFGQREHLAMILTAPFVLLTAARVMGAGVPRSLGVVSGLAAALGFALKPFFLAAWLLLEVWLVWRRGLGRLGRPETLALVAAGAAYLAAVLLLVPDYLPFALAWRDLYARFLRNTVLVSMVPFPVAGLPLFGLVAVLAGRHRLGDRPLSTALLLAALGFWLGAVLQRKAVDYHYVAAIGYALLTLAAVGVEARGLAWRRPSGAVLHLARGAVAVVGLLVVGRATADLVRRGPRAHIDQGYHELLAVVRREAAGGPFAVLSSNPVSGWPLTSEAGARWASRYVGLWPLAAIYWDGLRPGGGFPGLHPLDRRSGLERTFHEHLVEDLLRHRPRLILVLNLDRRTWAAGATQLDYRGYLLADPRMRVFFQGYQDLGAVGRYQVLRRR